MGGPRERLRNFGGNRQSGANFWSKRGVRKKSGLWGCGRRTGGADVGQQQRIDLGVTALHQPGRLLTGDVDDRKKLIGPKKSPKKTKPKKERGCS